MGWGRETLVPEVVVQFLTLRGCAAPPEGAVPQESVTRVSAAKLGLFAGPLLCFCGAYATRRLSRGLEQPAVFPRPGKPYGLPSLVLRKAKSDGVCVCVLCVCFA